MMDRMKALENMSQDEMNSLMGAIWARVSTGKLKLGDTIAIRYQENGNWYMDDKFKLTKKWLNKVLDWLKELK